MQKQIQYYTIGEVSRLTGVDTERIRYLWRSNKMPRPKMLGHLYMLTELDVIVIKALIERQGGRWRRYSAEDRS